MIAYIGLGSNVGDRLANLRRAVRWLRQQPGIVVRRASSVYDTDPVGTSGRNFLNAVVEVSTTLGPHELLEACKRIERLVGRTPRGRWGPREVDLDVLLFGEETIESLALRVPHPQMHARAFVRVPLAELGVREPGDERGVRFWVGPDALR